MPDQIIDRKITVRELNAALLFIKKYTPHLEGMINQINELIKTCLDCKKDHTAFGEDESSIFIFSFLKHISVLYEEELRLLGPNKYTRKYIQRLYLPDYLIELIETAKLLIQEIYIREYSK